MSARRFSISLPPPPRHFSWVIPESLSIYGAPFLQPSHLLLLYSPGLNFSRAFLLEQVPSGKNSTWGVGIKGPE